ncbi:MAG: Smr/MutS family protein [Alphaproteobacteria bacterium]|nr:Smr/MutS family protein [Alphaproteobacteria bacterium]
MSRKSKQLTNEDRILWGQVARTVDALPGRMEDLLATNPDLTPDRGPMKQETKSKPSAGVAAFDAPRKTMRQARQRDLNPIDGPVHRKLARGRLPLEASLDLHGLTQNQAFAMLHGFLTRARQKGLRHVLVITGKGTSYGSDGALRRAVPIWLRGPELKDIASGFKPAARGHGGDGALYVRLRKLER